jgi:hypothetical protein
VAECHSEKERLTWGVTPDFLLIVSRLSLQAFEAQRLRVLHKTLRARQHGVVMTVLSGALKPYRSSFIFTVDPFWNKLILFGMSTGRRKSGMEYKVGRRFGMTYGYDYYQNAVAERISGILKGQFLLNRPSDLKQASKMVAQSVRIYNQERPHTALQYRTPDAVDQACMQQ